jgi:hypothetical protein
MAENLFVHLAEAQIEEMAQSPQGTVVTSIQALNLIEFLLKNGPPSILSTFKY